MDGKPPDALIGEHLVDVQPCRKPGRVQTLKYCLAAPPSAGPLLTRQSYSEAGHTSWRSSTEEFSTPFETDD
jgi:hypothetical protein